MEADTELLVRYRQKLLAYLLHLAGDPHVAEDLLQELSVIVLAKPSILNLDGDVFAYLRGIARHLAAGHSRVRARTRGALRQWTEWAWENDLDDGSTDEDLRRELGALKECRGHLAAHARRLLELRYDSGWPIKEIARALGSQATAVKVALFRVRQALAKCIRGRLAGAATS